MRWNYKKLGAVLLLALFAVVFVAPLATPRTVHAQALEPADPVAPGGSIDYEWLTCIPPFSANPWCAAYAARIVSGAKAGIGVAVGAVLVDFSLSINEKIFTTPAVQIGFTLMLAFANLGFVLGLIVIAIMTIFRSQTYGAKQILWKLVIMAILINFSFTFAQVAINFSDQLTRYFVEKINGTDSLHIDIGGAIASALQPQAASQAPNTDDSFLDTAWQAVKGGLDKVVSLFLNMLLGEILSLFIALFFIGLSVILFIRYAYLAILIILMPFAWLMWVFPSMQSNWSKWWSNFIRWTFFPPIVVFFLYLALYTHQQGIFVQSVVPATPVAGSSVATVAGVVGNPGFVRAGLSSILILILAFAGLFAANALSITGAATAIGLAKGAGKWATGTVSGMAKRGGRMAFGAAARRTGLAEKAKGVVSGAQKATGLQRYIRGLAGIGMTKLAVAGGKDEVADVKKRYEKEDISVLQARRATAVGDAQKTALDLLIAEKHGLGNVDMAETHGSGVKERFESFGLDNEYHKNIEVETGVSADAYQKMIDGDANGFQAAMHKFVTSLTQEETRLIRVNDLFASADKDKYGMGFANRSMLMNGLTNSIAFTRHPLAAQIVPHLKGDESDIFDAKYRRALADLMTVDSDRGKKASEAYDKIVANNAIGFGGGAPAGSPTPTPTPTPSPGSTP